MNRNATRLNRLLKLQGIRADQLETLVQERAEKQRAEEAAVLQAEIQAAEHLINAVAPLAVAGGYGRPRDYWQARLQKARGTLLRLRGKEGRK